ETQSLASGVGYHNKARSLSFCIHCPRLSGVRFPFPPPKMRCQERNSGNPACMGSFSHTKSKQKGPVALVALTDKLTEPLYTDCHLSSCGNTTLHFPCHYLCPSVAMATGHF
uniref:Uncharacterized protein n=1 Tax=Melopsittacus undulatus TaxID=13146 RepID=A0A8V5GSM3_MELUD